MNGDSNLKFGHFLGRSTWVTVALFIAGFLSILPSRLLAGAGSSNYTILHDSLTSGGGRSASSLYQVESSIGGFGGAARGADGQIVVWLSHPGQLNDAPAISGPKEITLVGGSSPLNSIIITDAETDPSAIQLSATSSDSTLLNNISLGGTGMERTLQLFSAPGRIGKATVTVRATDEEGLEDSLDIEVTVSVPAPRLVPVIRWNSVTTIVYGHALSQEELNAIADVQGTFNYEPAEETILPAGQHNLTATFTPSDTVTYDAVTSSVIITVNPAPLTITAVDKAMIYGGGTPPLTAIYNGFVHGESVANLVDPGQISTTANPTSEVGTYQITISGAASANYSITTVPGTLTISPAPLEIKADDRIITQGQDIPVLTASYFGFVHSDTPLSLDAIPTISTTATKESVPGLYPIRVGGAFDRNYAITYVHGTLTIQAKNNVPVARNIYLERTAGEGARVSVFKLEQAAHDADGDSLKLTGFDTASTAGGVVRQDSGWLIYQPPQDYNEKDDFSFTITDAKGGTARGKVFISVRKDDQPPTKNITRVVIQDEQVTVHFVGIPGVEYQVQSSDSLTDPEWNVFEVAIAGQNGRFQAQDPRPPAITRFYRAVSVLMARGDGDE